MKKLFWIVYILCIPLFAFAQTNDAEYKAVASQDVNVRSERNAESSKVMTLTKGTKVIVKGSITATWVNVSYEGKSGYVNKRFLSIDETPIKKDTKEKPSKKPAVTVDMGDLLTVEHIPFLLICIAMLIFIIVDIK